MRSLPRVVATLMLVVGIVGIVGIVLVGAPTWAATAQASSERIVTYDVEIVVEDDGGVVVEETIEYDFGDNERRGIFRDIPVKLRFDDEHDRVFPLSEVTVDADPGAPDQFVTESAGAGVTRLRIGDPDQTITGRHTYRIGYRMDGVLNGFETHDELNWNAVGAGWNVPIERATVQVELPATVERTACFAGPVGSTLPCDAAASDGATARFAESSLQPFDAMTVVVAMPKGAVPEPTPILEERFTLARAFSVTPATVGAGGGVLVAVVAGFSLLAWKQGRDRRYIGSQVDAAFGNTGGDEARVSLLERHQPPVEFVPPDGLRPGQLGTLIDEVAHPLDVTATIVDLAVRGYLRIEEIPQSGWFAQADWRIVALRDGTGLRPYELLLFTSLFRGHPDGTVLLSDLKEEFAARLAAVQHALYDDAVTHGWFHGRPDKVRNTWRAIGVGALVLSVVIVAVVAASSELALVPLPLVLGGLLLLVGAGRMPRRTAKGTATLRRALGFKRFIDESEKDRAQFAERANLFSEYLPYAVVFGATERWARTFAGLDRPPPTPGWYVSSRPFDMLLFSHAISGFTVTTAGTIAATPAASGSSGFSSGGGFSGGGAGGGGGGSW